MTNPIHHHPFSASDFVQKIKKYPNIQERVWQLPCLKERENDAVGCELLAGDNEGKWPHLN
jgi:hypothetical protein